MLIKCKPCFNELLSFAGMFEALVESIATCCNGFYNENDKKEEDDDVAADKKKTVSSCTKCSGCCFINFTTKIHTASIFNLFPVNICCHYRLVKSVARDQHLVSYR